MANKQIINTFVAGMDKDTDKAFVSNKKYLDAHNYRLITTKGNTTGSLENVRGNYLLAGVGGNITSGQYIIGSCEIRDKVVLFTTNNTSTTPTAGRSQIYTLELNLESETQTGLTLIYDDNLNAGLAATDFLCFSTAHPIRAIARYETPNVQKVYWTDGFNNTRFANIAAYLTIDGTPYSAPSNYYMSVDKFEFLPKFIMYKPVLSAVVGGTLQTGVVQYSYQLYQINGSETAFSTPSDVIHINADSTVLSNTVFYTGDEETVNTGKGFQIQIDNSLNVGFNRLRMIRIYYPSLDATPVISICSEIEIAPTSSVVQVIDSGETLGELTLDEFNISSTELFVCDDIATKDNILFTSNIVKSEFDVDFDCRAIRFRASDNYALLKDSDGTQIGLFTVGAGEWALYTSDHDGINIFNDPGNDGDATKAYMYQADGTTLGAEGLNVKIDFAQEDMLLDVCGASIDYTFYATTTGAPVGDYSYSNFASTYRAGRLSWQRDEVYRLFVVFTNDRGQNSFPKWVCDLRMPSLHETTYSQLADYDVGTERITSKVLFPRIWFKSFPAGTISAQIYRVKRERSDRFVVTQGLMFPVQYHDSEYKPNRAASPFDASLRLTKLISPEILVNKNITKQANDYLEYVTDYHGYGTTTINGNQWTIRKCLQNNVIGYASGCKTYIDDAVSVIPSKEFVYLNSLKYQNHNDHMSDDGVGYGGTPIVVGSYGCSGLLIAYANGSLLADARTYCVANYKSNIYGSQYGGHTYEARLQNISVPCSDIITTTGAYNEIRGGDTYINFFDVATLLVDLTMDAANWHSILEALYIPLESSINLDLEHSESAIHRMWMKTGSGLFDYDYVRFTQEFAGAHEAELTGVVYTYNQVDDLYQYNTVYSQQGTARYAIANPSDKILETEFDCMVKASNKKVNGEISDSWTKFGVNEFIEVDSIHGPINALYTFNNRLVYFQDRAFGFLSVNDRSLISDNNPGQLVLGTGGVLDRFDYASTNAGCQDKFSIAGSKRGLYWYDRLSNFIYLYTGSLINLTREKLIQSYLDNSSIIVSTSKVLALSDVKNEEILFSFIASNETSYFTISYNEIVDSFVSFYDFMPLLFIPYKQRYLTTTTGKDRMYLHDSLLANRCYFYGAYVNSTLDILFNPEFESTKVFDNLFYVSNASSTTSDIFSVTFSSLRCYNNFQNSSTISLTPGTNIERRERGWTLAVPRNAVNANVSTNPNITTAVDTTQLFKERMRDKYLICIFTYTNNSNNYRFTVTDMGLKYRTSIR